MGDHNAEIYVGYARQSLGRAGDKGDSVSVADQFRALENYAERLGGKIVARYSDVDISGATESRDGLDRLLDDVKTIRPAAVLIRDVSRLARDTRIFLSLVDTLQRSGVKLLSSTESLEDRTISVMISAMAERERLALAGRVAGGVREHARRGKTHGSPAFGYRRVDGQLVIYEPEAAMMRQVFAWAAAGVSVTQICNRLNSDPLMPKPPAAAAWKHDTVTKMLRRRVYAGDVEIKANKDISGRSWPAVDVRDAHEALVPRETFDAVQRHFAGYPAIVRGAPASPLSGLLFCAHCGARLHLMIRNVAADCGHRARVLRIARCGTTSARHRDGVAAPICPGRQGSRMLEHVERAVFAHIETMIADDLAAPDDLRARVAAVIARDVRQDDRAVAQDRLAEIDRRRARLLDAYEVGSLDLMTWQGRDRVLAAEAEALTERIAAAPAPPDIDRLLAVQAALADLTLAPELFDYRQILAHLGARATVNLDNLAVSITVAPEFAPLFAPVRVCPP